jgi:hypothetical protein
MSAVVSVVDFLQALHFSGLEAAGVELSVYLL